LQVEQVNDGWHEVVNFLGDEYQSDFGKRTLRPIAYKCRIVTLFENI